MTLCSALARIPRWLACILPPLPPARVVRAPSACLQGVWRRERSAVAPPHDVELAGSLNSVSGCFFQSKGRRAARNRRRTEQMNEFLSPGAQSRVILWVYTGKTRFIPNSSVYVRLTPRRVFYNFRCRSCLLPADLTLSAGRHTPSAVRRGRSWTAGADRPGLGLADEPRRQLLTGLCVTEAEFSPN